MGASSCKKIHWNFYLSDHVAAGTGVLIVVLPRLQCFHGLAQYTNKDIWSSLEISCCYRCISPLTWTIMFCNLWSMATLGSRWPCNHEVSWRSDTQKKPSVRLVFVSFLVVQGSDIGANIHIWGSIPHIRMIFFLLIIDLANDFHCGLGPPIFH